MKQTQQNRLSMHRAVSVLNKAHTSAWDQLPAFARAQTALDASIAARDHAAEVQSVGSKGVTTDKEHYASDAISAVLKIARSISAYALDARNYELSMRFGASKSHLLYLPDNEQLAKLTEMTRYAGTIIGKLADYGVTQSLLDEANARIKVLKEHITSPRDVIDAQASATGVIGQQETLARYALEVMDNLMHHFEEDFPDYVREYKQARIIVDSGRRRDKGDDGTKEE